MEKATSRNLFSASAFAWPPENIRWVDVCVARASSAKFSCCPGSVRVFCFPMLEIFDKALRLEKRLSKN